MLLADFPYVYEEDLPKSNFSHSAIYFVADEKRNLIKIGRSVNVRRRLAHLRHLCKTDHLRLMAYFTDCEYEWFVHQRYKDLRVFGEWFRPEPRLVFAILDGSAVNFFDLDTEWQNQ